MGAQDKGSLQAESPPTGVSREPRRVLPMATPLPASQVGKGVDTPRRGATDSGARTQSPNAQSPTADATDQTMNRIWAKNDHGQRGLGGLYGSTGQISSACTMIMMLIPLLPIYFFAPQHMEWNKTPVASLGIFAEILKKLYPSLYEDILGVAQLKGTEAKEALRKITTRLFGMFGHQVHSAFLYELMVCIRMVPG